MRVHVHSKSGKWIISYFQEVYNHKFLEDRLTCMLSGHREMDAVVLGLKRHRFIRIFVHTAEGFQNVPFLKRDMYNQIGKQRRLIGGNAIRNMWVTTHIRGHFFGGFRTNSRCEGLHSMLGKFIHAQHNLRNFFEQFMRCISQRRSGKAHSDMLSMVGDVVL
ncbi:hypothetical protein Ahy_B02g058844 [Arachis hypogaea]|uniref:Protein FAR1-RELATED SEQUENCE n=1 Tax=Arachis hypogaea TaxID=3818 RepID=A0A445AFJ1_ARAHY|nr:hypothetical protein Ahy_B02g058844 [Arachis hypogaea]